MTERFLSWDPIDTTEEKDRHVRRVGVVYEKRSVKFIVVYKPYEYDLLQQ